jgi:hypothetical protein
LLAQSARSLYNICMADPDKASQQRRIDQMLQEIRVILPGTQAVLGFQFIAFFNASFKELSGALQVYHLVNLILITFCAILLITPVALQELRTKGPTTKVWATWTSRFIGLAMFFLLAGVAGDVFVAGNLLEVHNTVLAGIAAGIVFVVGMIMWFGLTLLRRR